MSKRTSNPGYGKAFTFHGSFVSLILARRREREIQGSFIHQHKGRYYVLKPKRIKTNPAYRGYLIRQTITGEFFIEKDKQLISWAKSEKHAKEIIDSLLNTKNPRKKRSCYVIPNPRKAGTLIYGRVLKIFAQKTSGPFKGQRFVHAFKAGAIMYGMPDGSLKIVHK